MQYFIDITSAMSGLLVAFVPKLQQAVERHAEVPYEQQCIIWFQCCMCMFVHQCNMGA